MLFSAFSIKRKCPCTISKFLSSKFLSSKILMSETYSVSQPLNKVQKISLFSANCPFGNMSFRRKVHSSKYPFVKMSVRQNVRRQNVHSAKCLSAKCLSAKCPGTAKVWVSKFKKFKDMRFLPQDL